MANLGNLLSRIVARTLLLSAAGGCLGRPDGEKFVSVLRPPEGKHIRIADDQCHLVCANFLASKCHFTLTYNNSVKLWCQGEQKKREADGRKPGDHCTYRMGHPEAVWCAYTAEQDENLVAEWELFFDATHIHKPGPLVLWGESCTPWCGKPVGTCEILPQKQLQTNCETAPPPSGRRPPGMTASSEQGDSVERFLRRAAALEAASVAAFRQLARELVQHRAPADFVRRARRAAREEARHFRALRALLAVRGVSIGAAHIAPSPARTLLALALDNAVEGCVRETFGAMCALWQARTAPTAELRATLASIARDETGHAELSWDLARWLATQLTAADRRSVALAVQAAADELTAEQAGGFSPELTSELGLPTASQARELLGGLRTQVLSL